MCFVFSLINPVKLLHELEDSMDDNSIIVADGGDFVGTAAYILRYVYTHLRRSIGKWVLFKSFDVKVQVQIELQRQMF